MQEKYGHFEPLGICQKLYRFVVNGLIGRGLKRVTLGHEARQCSTTAPPYGGSPGSTSGGQEIQVHFKQTEEQFEHWTSFNLASSPVGEARKYGQHDILVKGPLPDGMVILQGNGIANGNIDPAEAPEKAYPRAPPERKTTLARGKPPNKALSMQDVSEEEKDRKKGKNVVLSSEKSAVPTASEEPKAKHTFPMHHISVAPNINEKSDAFIRRKRQAMGLNGLLSKKP